MASFFRPKNVGRVAFSVRSLGPRGIPTMMGAPPASIGAKLLHFTHQDGAAARISRFSTANRDAGRESCLCIQCFSVYNSRVVTERGERP